MNKRSNEELPDINIVLTAAERRALRDIDSLAARCLYIELSFYRDFETNRVGEKTKLSHATLRHALAHESGVGRRARKLSNNHILRWLRQLEKGGLIQVITPHIFYLPLASQGRSAPWKSNSISSQFAVTVTESVTESVTNENNNNENSIINEELNINENLGQNLLQNPGQNADLSQENEGICNTISAPYPFNHLTKLNYTKLAPARFKNFIDLLKSRGFHENQIANKRVIAMLAAWHQAGITVEEAEIGMNHCDRGKTERPHPTYYESAVLEYKRDLHKAKQKIEKIEEPANENPGRREAAPARSRSQREITAERMAKWVAEQEASAAEEDERGDD